MVAGGAAQQVPHTASMAGSTALVSGGGAASEEKAPAKRSTRTVVLLADPDVHADRGALVCDATAHTIHRGGRAADVLRAVAAACSLVGVR